MSRRDRTVIVERRNRLPLQYDARLPNWCTWVVQQVCRLFCAKYRPGYPPELYDAILKHGHLPARDLAIDIATGSGQAAKGLSSYFSTVMALDHDSEQLKMHLGRQM